MPPTHDEILAKLDQALAGGLDHAVMVGYGEPTLSPILPQLLDDCHERGMATSIITNGSTGLGRFKGYFRQGLDHLHISSHGLDGTLDDIVGRRGVFRKQAELKEWLASEELPFRTNVTLQDWNYRELAELAEYEVEHHVFHFVVLGFLPHYHWDKHLREVAVHPAVLRPHIEYAARVLLESDVYFTIRYHPLCHLLKELWPFVVNARYVPFDPWEWNYELQVTDLDALWQSGVSMGDSVACRKPCDSCKARRHCGGWNKTYAEAFDGAGLVPITEVPDEFAGVWETDGGLHDLNPVNGLSGTIRG